MNTDKIHDYSLIMDAMPGLSMLVDQSGLIVHINAHTQYLSGYPESAILGTKIENLPFSSSCTVDSQTGQLHTTWFLLDGNTIELVWNSVSIVLGGDKYSLFSAIQHPPSVIQHIEPTLENMDCGFCVIDENAKLIYANKIISEISGYDLSELPGMEISRLLEPFKPDYWCKFWNKLSKKIYGTLGKITKKTGQTRYLRLKCRKADWNGTQSIHCLVQDCTLEYEKNLEEQNKLATIKLISDITFKLATNPYNKNLLTEQMGILGAKLDLDSIMLVNLVGSDGRYELFCNWVSNEQYESKLPEFLPKPILSRFQELIQNKRHLLKHTLNVVFPDPDNSILSGVKTTLHIPIKTRNSLWGVLAFISCRQEREWKKWEIDLCDSFVASLSVIFDSINRLKESLARYETLAETVQNGILVLHGENVIYFNHACQEITGYGRDELLSRSFFDFVHPDEKQKVIDNYRKRQTGQNIKPLETLRIITKDGKEKTLKYWINSDKVDDMDVFIVTFSDVTDLVIAREKALQSSAMIETIISTVHDVLYIKDLQGRFLYFRWPKQEQAGKNFDHYIGRTLHELTPEMNDLETVENYRRQVVETGKPVKFTRSMILVNWDEPTEYETQVTPLLDNQGKMIGTIGIAHNITEEIVAKRKLEELENKLTTISETITDIIFQLDGTKIIYISPAVRTYGFEPEELIGMNVASLFSFDVSASLDETGQKSFETCFKSKHGTEHDMEVKLAIEGSRIIGVARDISERKNHEKAKKNFLKSVAHELRNPLTLVLGYSELLMSSTKNDKTLNDMASIIFDAAESEKKRLNEFFDMDKTIIDYNFEVVSTWKLLNNTYTKLWMLVPKMARQKHGTDKTSFGFFVSPELKQKKISVDTNKFSEIIENLASNSVKYSPPDRIALFLSAKSDEDKLIIKFSDKGIGINEKDIPMIFKPFYQINAPGYEQDGLGLGLANVKMHVQAHNGTIQVQSRTGEGSDFILTFPLYD